MKAKFWQMVASTSLIGLIFLCLAWELWLAPLRPGGSWLVLKTLPLLWPLFGILRGRRYTYQWASMFILLYCTEGILRTLLDSGVAKICAALEMTLAIAFYMATLWYCKQTRITR